MPTGNNLLHCRLVTSDALDALERIAFGTVAVTATSLDDIGGHELTFLGWRALVVLGAAGEPLRATDLGARLGTSRSSTSKLLRRLDRRGLVELASDPGDGRVVLVGLSGRGVELRRAVLARRRELLAEALAEPLPASLPDGLAAIADRLTRWT